jgi:hypothetical protein
MVVRKQRRLYPQAQGFYAVLRLSYNRAIPTLPNSASISLPHYNGTNNFPEYKNHE